MLSSRDPQLAEVFESPPWQSELFRRQRQIDGCGQSKRGHRLREQLVAGARRHAGAAGLPGVARRAAWHAAGLPGTALLPGTAGRGARWGCRARRGVAGAA